MSEGHPALTDGQGKHSRELAVSEELDLEPIRDALFLLARSLGIDRVSPEVVDRVIRSVLFGEPLDGFAGKGLWLVFQHELLTERELRNLVMANASTRLAYYSGIDEPGVDMDSARPLCEAFELALFGHRVAPTARDLLDPWENASCSR